MRWDYLSIGVWEILLKYIEIWDSTRLFYDSLLEILLEYDIGWNL